MSLLSSLLVGSSGLRAANAGIQTTAHNVANASTEGYHVRSVEQRTADPVRLGRAWMGQGVDVTDISRATDQFLGMRQLDTAGDAAAAGALHTSLKQVEAAFDESTADGLRERLDQLFDSLDAATADPADRGLRIAVSSALDRFTQVVRRTATDLGDRTQNFEEELTGSTDAINEKIGEIASLNRSLQAAGGALSAGDLADQRDTLIRDLASDIGATAHYDGEGRATVLLGGHALVSGIEARELSVDTSSGTPEVFVSADSGTVNLTDTVGGKMAGRIEAHTLTADYADRLDTFVTDFSTALNAAHAGGFDRTSTPGTDLVTFDTADPAITFLPSAAILQDPDLLAFASAAPSDAGDAGNLDVLRALRDGNVIGSTSSTPEEWLTDLTSDVGRDVDTAATASEASDGLLSDLDELDQNLHGVDLDEQATDLVTYQTAYQAAAKVVQASSTLLRTLMELS